MRCKRILERALLKTLPSLGAQVIAEEVGMKLDKTELSQLGSCKKVTISKEDTILLHGAGTQADL